MTVKAKTVLDCDLMPLISVIYEVELYNKWFPFVKKVVNLKNINKASKVCFMCQSPPFVSDREMFIWGYGVDR